MVVILDAAAAAAAIAADASVVCGWVVTVAGAMADTPSDVAVVVKMGLDGDVVVVVTELESIGAEAAAADTAMDDEDVLFAGTGTVEEDEVGKSCDKGGNSSCCK